MDYVYTYCAAFTFGKGSDSEHLHVGGASNLSELQHKLRTKFMVRRPKSILNLPPKTRQLVPLPAEGLAKAVEAEMTAMERVRAALGVLEELNQPTTPAEPAQAYTTLLEALDRRFSGYQDQSYEECIQYLSEPEQVAFEELSIARKALAAAKVPMVVEFIENTLATTEKVIVFVVHTEMANALKEAFPDAAMITGKTPHGKRQDQVDRFQTDPNCRLFIGNITAAGVGFTMTAASTVVFAELDWVPAKIEQAEDRAWRIGQTNAVLIMHLAVENSLDAHLVNVVLEKQAVIHNALDADASLPPNLTVDEILAYERQQDQHFGLRLSA
jgi:SNF2 family DNA or RNA helicase